MDVVLDEKPIMVFQKEKRLEAKKRKIEAFLKLVSAEPSDSPTKKNKTELPDDIAINGPSTNSTDCMKTLRQDLRKYRKETEPDPSFYLTEYGLKAQVNFKFYNEDIPPGKTISPLFVEDIHNLLMKVIYGIKSIYDLRWCKVLRPHKVSKVLVLVVEGLSKDYIIKNISAVKNMVDVFPNMVEVVSSNSPFATELTTLHLTPEYQKKFLSTYNAFASLFPIKKENNKQKYKNESKEFSKIQLLLSPVQLVMENYPLPKCVFENSRSEGYCFTKDSYSHVNSESAMFAIDCEMCRTETGRLEVTSIAIVDEELQTVYTTLVKPKDAIVDYLTKFSGITEEMLVFEKTTLSDVQKQIQNILPSDAILCGQSLNCDLHALQMIHPYVIDTSVIFNASGIRNKKDSLKRLAFTYLNEIIQDNKKGHCPIEDSIATMKLVQLKLENGMMYGDAVFDKSLNSLSNNKVSSSETTDAGSHSASYFSKILDNKPAVNDNDKTTITNELTKKTPTTTCISKAKCFFGKILDSGKKVCVIGNKTSLDQYHSEVLPHNVHKIVKNSTRKIVKTTTRNMNNYDLTISNLVFDCNDNSPDLLEQLDSHVKQLYDNCSDKTLFITFASGTDKNQDDFRNGLCMTTLKYCALKL